MADTLVFIETMPHVIRILFADQSTVGSKDTGCSCGVKAAAFGRQPLLNGIRPGRTVLPDGKPASLVSPRKRILLRLEKNAAGPLLFCEVI